MKMSLTTSVLATALALGWSTAQAQPSGTTTPGTTTPGTTTPDPTVPGTTGTTGTGGRRTNGSGMGSGGDSATGPRSDTSLGADESRTSDDTTVVVPPPVVVDPTPVADPNRIYTAPAPADDRALTPLNRAVEPVPTPFSSPDRTARTGWRKIGGAVLLGGGFEDFTNSNLRSMTGGGGAWNARVVGGTYQVIGLEAAYVGAARSIDALGLGSNAALVANGLEGAFRLNVPLIRGASLVEPFGFVGLGWSRYNVTNTNTASSDVANRDDVMTLPYGGGLAYAFRGFIADARFTYRYTYQNDLMRTAGGRLNNWGVGTQLGYSF